MICRGRACNLLGRRWALDRMHLLEISSRKRASERTWLAILTLFSVRMWGNRPPTFPVWFFSNMVKDLTLLCRCADKQKREREREREKKKACFFFQPKGKAQTAAALTQLAPPLPHSVLFPHPGSGLAKWKCGTVSQFTCSSESEKSNNSLCLPGYQVSELFPWLRGAKGHDNLQLMP